MKRKKKKLKSFTSLWLSKEKKMSHSVTCHHRKPTSIGGTNQDRNISFIFENKHQAWHTLFGNMTAEDICCLINDIYLDPDFKFVFTKRNP